MDEKMRLDIAMWKELDKLREMGKAEYLNASLAELKKLHEMQEYMKNRSNDRKDKSDA